MRESRTKPAHGLVIRGGLLLTQEDETPRRGDLWIQDGRIVAIDPPEAAPPADDRSIDVGPTEGGTRAPDAVAWEEIDARELWILPGFVAGHVHLCQTLIRGAAEGLDLYRWLEQVIWPMEAAHDWETMAVSAEAGIEQLLAGGVTTLLDMGTTRHTGAILETAARMGIRGFFGPALMDRGPEAAGGLLRPASEALDEVATLAAQWEGYDDDRIRLALCPRFIPSVTDPFWRQLAAESAFATFPIHTHGSETRDEVAEVRRLTGRTPPAYFAALPRAEGRIKMAHGVWLDGDDRRQLRDSGTTVLHCPGSNLKLGSGLCDTLTLLAEGVSIALGPDGAPCNNRLDPWQEMRLAAWLQGLTHRPSAVDPASILRLATLDGARALGLGDEIGSLAPGKRADLVLLDPSADPALCGAGSAGETPAAALVFAGSPALVRETIVAGRVVWRRNDPERPARDRERMGRAIAARRALAERTGHALTQEESS